MKSRRTAAFRSRFDNLPPEAVTQAQVAYRFWRANPRHPSLDFKAIAGKRGIYSVRIGLHWRAVARVGDDGGFVWFWIGSHAEYDKLLRRL